MKQKSFKYLSLVLALVLFATILAGCNAKTTKRESLILATTTSLYDSGLLSKILPDFTKETGIKVKTIAVGTGEALKMGQNGDADVLLVHSPEKEKEMIAKGYIAKRTPFMHNFFIIVGPKKDPAGVKNAASAEEAFRKISKADATFVSRGDNSGTNNREVKIWENSTTKVTGNYVKTGQGMGMTLQVANEKGVYTLTDEATFLSLKDKIKNLTVLLSNKKALKNTYSVLQLNERKVKFKKDLANKFQDWLLLKKTLKKISKFGKAKYGKALFIIN